ncbi:MAG: phage portal protein [Clostridiales bacterium]|nr:phage portal protein [Clostridiales bacterium]
MILYMDREEVPDIENIRPEVLRYVVEQAERANGRFDRLHRYYRGDHDNLRKGQPEQDEVRVAINYAKYVVDITLGYYLGDPVKYDANDTHDMEGGPEIDLSELLNCYDNQQISEVDSRVGKGMGVFGECLELCYASSDPDPEPRSAYIDPRCGVLVEDSTVEHNKLFALVWEKREKVSHEKYYFLTVYTDRTEKDYTSTDLKTAIFHQVNETREHFFGEVPVIAYENNDERQGDFEQIISLIDAYDDLMSNRFTDKKRFVDALLVFFGMSLREGDEEQMLRNKFIDGAPLDAKVEYIQKTFDESSVQVLADAAVREMHKMTLTVDMSDESFAGNSSGQALKLKLLTMNLLVKNKMRRMERGLKERLVLYNRWLTTMGTMKEVSPSDVDVVFALSTPINETEIVQLVTSLQGIVDDETLLSQLWFIRDPAEAVENVRKQQQEKQAAYQQTFGVPQQTEDNDAEKASQQEGERKKPVGFQLPQSDA